jgi:hypothetical protein
VAAPPNRLSYTLVAVMTRDDRILPGALCRQTPAIFPLSHVGQLRPGENPEADGRSERSDSQIAAETAGHRAAGGTIVEIRPDVASGAAFGPNSMDGGRQPLVFGAGLRQGLAAAGDVAARIG